MDYTRRNFLKAMGIAAAAMTAPHHLLAKNNKQPNIIFFLVDDLGWMDTSVYGSTYYETPNIKKLSNRGVTFTNAYSASPLCSPTRASILTGKYPGRLKFTAASGHQAPQTDEPVVPMWTLPKHKVVAAQSRNYLPLEEYTIAEAFKDAGYQTAFIGKWHLGAEKWWPKAQGFDDSIAVGHFSEYFSPYNIKSFKDGPEGEYITDRLTDEALNYINNHYQNPFMLFLSHYGVHDPLGHKEEITKKFRKKTDPRGKQNNPVIASMIYSIDESLGRILEQIDRLNITDNTIIIFSSDNGGNTYSIANGKHYTNNFPLRQGKAFMYEGGTRIPTIIAWPGIAKANSKCSEVISSIDFYPTMLQMAGIKPQQGHIVDGISLAPLLAGKTDKLNRNAIFCHLPHHFMGLPQKPSTYVRKGDWKLIRFYADGKNQENRYELYNLKNDIGETQNLANKHPELVKRLDLLIDKFLKDTGSLVPRVNYLYEPAKKTPEAPLHKN